MKSATILIFDIVNFPFSDGDVPRRPSYSITQTCPCNIQQYFTAVKNDNFQMKIFDIFLIFAQNIGCRYTLEPPQRGGSNEYPPSMLWSKNKKNMYTRENPTFSI